MILLEFLSGSKVGSAAEVRRFPWRLGRSPRSHLVLDDDGVWEQHLEIQLDRTQGFFLQTRSEAFVAVNGQKVERHRLASGDVISVGAARIRFSLAPTRLRGLRFREVLTWISLALFALGQVGLIYWLLES